jgi:glycosyltransferase involved in cell wall biosynthesis
MSDRVDVVLPVYNGQRWLAEAIDSVLDCGDADVEVVAVDDASTDGSRRILESYAARGARLRVVGNAVNSGIAATRNVGLAHASGRLVSFLDQDDLWVPGRLAVQRAVLDAAPEVGYVLGHAEHFLEPGHERPSWFKPDWAAQPQEGHLLTAMLARRDVFDLIGGFDESRRYGTDDVDWFGRAKVAGVRSAMVPDVVMRRRVHDANHSAQTRQANIELLRFVREQAARNRARAGEP